MKKLLDGLTPTTQAFIIGLLLAIAESLASLAMSEPALTWRTVLVAVTGAALRYLVAAIKEFKASKN